MTTSFVTRRIDVVGGLLALALVGWTAPSTAQVIGASVGGSLQTRGSLATSLPQPRHDARVGVAASSGLEVGADASGLRKEVIGATRNTGRSTVVRARGAADAAAATSRNATAASTAATTAATTAALGEVSGARSVLSTSASAAAGADLEARPVTASGELVAGVDASSSVAATEAAHAAE